MGCYPTFGLEFCLFLHFSGTPEFVAVLWPRWLVCRRFNLAQPD